MGFGSAVFSPLAITRSVVLMAVILRIICKATIGRYAESRFYIDAMTTAKAADRYVI
jgi:hypothetical protein